MVKQPFKPMKKIVSAKQKQRVTTIKQVVKKLHRPIKRVAIERVANAPLSKAQIIKSAIAAGFNATLFEYLNEGWDSAWFRKYGGHHLEALRKAGFSLSF